MPRDANSLKQFLKDRITATQQLATRLASPENPVPLTQADKDLLETLTGEDQTLMAILN